MAHLKHKEIGGKATQTLIESWGAPLKSEGKKTKSMIWYRKGQCIKIKSSLGDTILNLHVPDEIVSKIRKQGK